MEPDAPACRRDHWHGRPARREAPLAAPFSLDRLAERERERENQSADSFSKRSGAPCPDASITGFVSDALEPVLWRPVDVQTSRQALLAKLFILYWSSEASLRFRVKLLFLESRWFCLISDSLSPHQGPPEPDLSHVQRRGRGAAGADAAGQLIVEALEDRLPTGASLGGSFWMLDSGLTNHPRTFQHPRLPDPLCCLWGPVSQTDIMLREGGPGLEIRRPGLISSGFVSGVCF